MTLEAAAKPSREFAPAQSLPAGSWVRIRNAERRELDTVQVLLALLHVAQRRCEVVLVVGPRCRGLGVDWFVHRVQDPDRMRVAVGLVPSCRTCRVRP